MTQESSQTNLPSDSSDSRDCFLLNAGRISYADALNLQHDFHKKCVHSEIAGILLLLEHDPVITMGVKTGRGNILVDEYELVLRGIKLVNTDRGGDVTYHGPGQLVGYPILNLRALGIDLHSYLRTLEQSIINLLAIYGLQGERHGPAGVWVGDRKVCSIGVTVRKMVTYHGFALNMDPNMTHFTYINPCGLAAVQMTSIKQLLGKVIDMAEVRDAYTSCFAEAFGFTLKPWCDPS